MKNSLKNVTPLREIVKVLAYKYNFLNSIFRGRKKIETGPTKNNNYTDKCNYVLGNIPYHNVEIDKAWKSIGSSQNLHRLGGQMLFKIIANETSWS